MRTAAAVFGLLLGNACGFHSSASGTDAATDACTSFASQLDTCALPLGTDLAISGAATYDTSSHVLTIDGQAVAVAHATLPAGAGDVDAILAKDVRILRSASLRATGALPLAIVASGTVIIEEDAKLDVGEGGAGALVACTDGATAGGDNTGGGGGGGGGGYGAEGGAGGMGNSDRVDKSAGGMAGKASPIPAGPRGGCPGGRGGNGDVDGAAGGAGGGAIYVVSAGNIELGNGAVITAGGAGGAGGARTANSGGSGDAGGGGGGSGGMIFLEAQRVYGPFAALVANGGGGGEGSSEEQAGRPGDGASLSAVPAGGGIGGSSNGADGGIGGSRDVPQGLPPATTLAGGGGGGGGGVGYIRVKSSVIELGLISPARTPVPGD